MKIVTPEDAVRTIRDGSLVVFPGGCADPLTFYRAFQAEVENFRHLTVCSGFSFGSYAYLERGLGEHFTFLTWQASPRLRKLFEENDPAKVRFVPIRLAEVATVVSAAGPIKPDLVLVQTSPPQQDGTVSLGVSVGPNLDFVRSAKVVIAEFNPNMPVTAGDSRIALEAIDYAIESDTPIATYRTPQASPRDQRIIENVLSLVPDNAWVQLGIGSVPDRILARLAELRGINLFSGLLTSGLQTFLENSGHDPTVVVGELAGDEAFYDFCSGNEQVQMAPTSVTHGMVRLAELKSFVSINSCIEVDLHGQSNGEMVNGVQISGVGGALDYVEAAALSPGGVSIIALPSTTADGKRSKIVAKLGAGSVVTTPRYCIDYIITEHGIARLKGKDIRARADALIAIAHPDFRDQLADSFS